MSDETLKVEVSFAKVKAPWEHRDDEDRRRKNRFDSDVAHAVRREKLWAKFCDLFSKENV